MKKYWGYLLISVLLALGMTTAIYGADTKIDKVKVTFSFDEEPKSGASIGNIYAATDNQEFTIDQVEYVTDAEEWSVGDRPVVRVEMSAKDGYRFAYTSKSHFTLSGGSAEFKKARYYDDASVMELEVYLKRIGGRLSVVDNLEWSGTYAEWDELNGAKSYEVRLYRDGKSVATVSTTGESYNFSGYMTKVGSYTFRVRGIAKYDDRAGEWSDPSYDYDIDKDDIGKYPDSAGWKQSQYGWWYSYGNGLYPVNRWDYINGTWYYFNGQGYMLTGWQLINGSWYYLQPDGAMAVDWQFINGNRYYLHSSGVMQTGWQYINNCWYYLAGNGAMQTGWQYINNCWYYLDNSGMMYANRMTPDGHYVDSTGAMVY